MSADEVKSWSEFGFVLSLRLFSMQDAALLFEKIVSYGKEEDEEDKFVRFAFLRIFNCYDITMPRRNDITMPVCDYFSLNNYLCFVNENGVLSCTSAYV